jgi:hypothetical protein
MSCCGPPHDRVAEVQISARITSINALDAQYSFYNNTGILTPVDPEER